MRKREFCYTPVLKDTCLRRQASFSGPEDARQGTSSSQWRKFAWANGLARRGEGRIVNVLEVINFVRMKIKLVGSFSILLINIFFHLSELSAQSETSTVNFLIVQNTFSDYRENKSLSPKPLSLRKKSFLSKMNPLNYASAGLLFFYQSVLSEQIQSNCNYEISCSNYTKKCAEKFGLLKGILLGFDQLTNCSVAQIYDFPSYKISSRSKIINAFEAE